MTLIPFSNLCIGVLSLYTVKKTFFEPRFRLSIIIKNCSSLYIVLIYFMFLQSWEVHWLKQRYLMCNINHLVASLNAFNLMNCAEHKSEKVYSAYNSLNKHWHFNKISPGNPKWTNIKYQLIVIQFYWTIKKTQ